MHGHTKIYTYDSFGNRLTTTDANGNVLTVIDENGTVTRSYDALNRVVSVTDTFGKIIRYEYDAVGNLTKMIYPDNTAVSYEYDENRNLTKVTDWANRVTSYTYDVNNRVVGVSKPDGSISTTVYDAAQRITSSVERTALGVIISGYEYTYDNLSRISTEKDLAKNIQICYTYDSLGRVVTKTIKTISDETVVSSESYRYDAAGNIVDAPDSCYQYDTNNRLISYCGQTVGYDMDGNMLSIPMEGVAGTFSYDSANRLIQAGCYSYTYTAENVRIRKSCCGESETTYTYNMNAKLSQLLMKTTDNVVTKYVYGLGLIGEESGNSFKTYHFDYRGSTVAITNESGTVTDTFVYDTYGKLIARTGSNEIIFGYNGRDGVVTDENGLIYMRTRYYSPNLRRFINADILSGKISDSTSLNRYAYVNGNPVSFIDPFGLGFFLALGIIAVCGLINAAVDAVSSIVEQTVTTGEVNWGVVANEAAWGFVEGAVEASPLGPVTKTVLDAGVSAGRQLTETYILSDNKEDGQWLKEVDCIQVSLNVVVDAAFSYSGRTGKNTTDNLVDEATDLVEKIKREGRRANREVAEERIEELKKDLFETVVEKPILDAVIPSVNDLYHEGTKKGVNYIYDTLKDEFRK